MNLFRIVSLATLLAVADAGDKFMGVAHADAGGNPVKSLLSQMASWKPAAADNNDDGSSVELSAATADDVQDADTTSTEQDAGAEDNDVESEASKEAASSDADSSQAAAEGRRKAVLIPMMHKQMLR